MEKHRFNTAFTYLSVCLSLSACAQSNDHITGLVHRNAVQGFDLPESAVFDEPTDSWFVSNIGSETGARDGDGFIAMLDPEGVPQTLRWLEGLDGPAGLAILGRRMYVADIDQLVVVDIDTGEVVERHPIAGAALLNDVAAGDGRIFVSDTFTGTIHVFNPGGEVQTLIRDEAFNNANGLFVNGDTLYVACTGSFTDFEEEAGLFAIDLPTLSVRELAGVRGKFDGMLRAGNDLLLTDFRGLVLRLDDAEQTSVLHDASADGASSTADFGWDAVHERLLIPDLFGGAVNLYDTTR